MNIIFTDIDGVLNPHFKKKWSKKAIDIYNRMCINFNLKPVVTSTWRTNHSIEQLNIIFKEQGIITEIYDVTIVLDQTARGIEIKHWLDNHPYDKYAIIDDKTSDIDPHVSNAVKCRSWIGLTEEEYQEVKKIFS